MKLSSNICITTLLVAAGSTKPTKRTTSSAILCASLRPPIIPGATIVSLQSRVLQNYTLPAAPPLLNNEISGINVCEVDVIHSHPNASDEVKTKIWLPLKDWNGRFLGTGGSGYAAGLFEYGLAPAVISGYAAASTDAGLSGDPYSPDLWALQNDGRVNLGLLTNFASRSVHEMAVAGKQISTEFYDEQPHHSYWNGCSTGGRQGLVSAQRFPADFDGIVAGAPAIDWSRYVVAEQWPQVVMKEHKTYINPCVLKAFTESSISACDSLDEVSDDVITDPSKCHFSPFSLVGTDIDCGGANILFTREFAIVIDAILKGPFPNVKPKSYALNVGAPLNYLANTTIVGGDRTGLPFFVNDAWLKYFVVKDPNFDTTTIGYSDFNNLFAQSQREYGDIIGSDDPNLSPFHAQGGKLIVWHGLADQLIFPQGTINYHHQVESALKGSYHLDDFYRTFLAPGVDHCGVGTTAGAVPVDPLSALVSWVEDGKAPEILEARTVDEKGTVLTRKICKYPLTSHYAGGGDENLAANYVCL